jgi:hypothetical protein
MKLPPSLSYGGQDGGRIDGRGKFEGSDHGEFENHSIDGIRHQFARRDFAPGIGFTAGILVFFG